MRAKHRGYRRAYPLEQAERSVMKSGWLIVVAAAAALSACGDPAQQLATAKPASGPALVKYSRNATAEVSLGANADLVQRF